MGVQIKDIVPIQESSLEQLQGKIIAIDAMNTLYQFLSIIRQSDGTPLKDSKGRITSHLSGLFYRTSNLIEKGIRPVFIFDGEPPELKSKTIETRRTLRAEAEKARKKALKEGKEKEALKYAQRSARLTEEMSGESKTLLDAMGVPWIQAPEEGEAQAARLTQNEDSWAAGSQDFDSLLFGAPRLLRNLTITGKRKLPGKDVYKEIVPEVISLEKLSEEQEITREQLIAIGILVGTDYNPGIKGIGPKRALKLVQEHGTISDILEAEEDLEFEVDPIEIEEIFLEPNVTDDYEVSWSEPNPDAIKEFLCEEHDFSESRINTGIERLEKGASKRSQESLEKWV
ncbi:endonuclease [candidate division MSBL1 archaeon SCGC-AAA261F17]|uniref:Flap endonuclease 1 n=1 Tax=candidate division MSBL1 archaeon SCGC-AAA261F17 TaxID=1698274 RepID=A0A133V607_9EURY|nr:endonuclease [candidate division MSBL1 archaeon SCGC-AAA261F17]